MDYAPGSDRHQMMMVSLDQMVDQHSFARIIDAFVDALQLKDFGFTFSELAAEGRPPYPPETLLKLYLYGYQSGIRSCRKLAQASLVNIEVMWLVEQRRPHYKTIANFRKDNPDAVQQVFRHFVAMLRDWKLVDGKTVAVDSVKLRAQNSLKNNFNQKKVDRHLAYLDERINAYFEELDHAEDEGQRKATARKLRRAVAQEKRYQAVGKALEEEGVDQISTTDPDAHAVILHRNIVHVGYNVQAASCAKHKLLIAYDTGAVNDTHALGPMVAAVQHATGRKRIDVLADKGYHTGAQLAQCEHLGVVSYVSPKESAVNKQYAVYGMDQFTYHAPSDTYRCPAGQVMRSTGTIYQRTSKSAQTTPVRFKHYRTSACGECALREHCTKSANGRIIQRSEHQAAIDRNNRRVNQNPEYYRRRQQVIEHQFGTLKRQWGITHTMMRTKPKVLAEVAMAFTVYDLKRCVEVLGFDRLMAKLKALKPYFNLIRNHRPLECSYHRIINQPVCQAA